MIKYIVAIPAAIVVVVAIVFVALVSK